MYRKQPEPTFAPLSETRNIKTSERTLVSKLFPGMSYMHTVTELVNKSIHTLKILPLANLEDGLDIVERVRRPLWDKKNAYRKSRKPWLFGMHCGSKPTACVNCKHLKGISVAFFGLKKCLCFRNSNQSPNVSDGEWGSVSTDHHVARQFCISIEVKLNF